MTLNDRGFADSLSTPSRSNHKPRGDDETERMIVEPGTLTDHPPIVRVGITIAASARVITPEGL